MKKIGNYIFRFILGVIFTTLLISGAIADTRVDGAAFLVEIGESYMEKGNDKDAIHEISKALMLDPTNKRAKELLAMYGLQEGLYTGVQTGATQMAKLAGDVKGYKEQMFQVSQKRTALESRIGDMQSERELLERSNQEKERQLQTLKEEVQRSHELLAQKVIDSGETLDVSEEGILPIAIKKDVADVRLVAMAAKNIEIRDQALRHQLKSEEMLKVMEDYLYLRKHDMGELDDQLIYSQLDLSKNQETLLAKMDELVHLQESARNTQQLLNERHFVVDERDLEIQILQEHLNRARREITITEERIQELVGEHEKILGQLDDLSE